MTTQLHPNLVGFRCIRCSASYPIGDYFEGCSVCAQEGYPASVTAEYRQKASVEQGGRLPLFGESYLGEGGTPLIALQGLAGQLDLAGLWAKFEGANPTGSHKDRMSRFVVARAQQLGYSKVVAASSGNAGVSIAATAARAGLQATIVVGRDAPGRWMEAIRTHGAEVRESPSSLSRWSETHALVRAGTHYPATNYLNPPVGSNPFGVQGYKSIAYELIDDLGDQEVDAIVVPTDRGDLLWGIFEGLRELQELGRLASMPRLYATEPYPRISAVLGGADYRGSFAGASSQVSIGGNTVTWQALLAARASHGAAVEVDDRVAASSRRDLSGLGISSELCSAASLGAVRALVADGVLASHSRVVLLVTANGELAPVGDGTGYKE